jgi:hypothetical protein
MYHGAGPQRALAVIRARRNTMRNIIEMAIEREAEMLDAIMEFPDLAAGSAYPFSLTKPRLNPLTRKFSARGTVRRRNVTRAIESPKYLN